MSLRLFIGLPVNDQVKNLQSTAQGQISEQKGIRWVANNKLHVTTCFIGDTVPEDLPRIKMLIKHISQGTQAMLLHAEQLCLKPARDPYMLWLLFRQHDGFTHLCHRLDKALLGKVSRSMVLPHITLARYKKKVNDPGFRIGKLNEELILPVEKIILYESILLPEGPRYTQLDENILAV